ncbi:MAG: apolipoprotein N-acyltransferase [Ignavibacteria bacterium GWA2_54_16]|nr:MAG: apolipoprotein N-acyltransferase [Ignavibacteria bacterium GWA2_54_16]
MTSTAGNEKSHIRVLHRFVLALASGILLGASFPPSPVHAFAYAGLIPLLVLLESIEGWWRALRYSYLSFLILHILTLYWTGGFVVGKDVWMMIAGGALLIVHPLFYVLVMALYFLIRRRLGLLQSLAALPFLWVAYEYSHALGEFSFPWITLGNSQAYDLPRIQVAEFTSVYGISFFIVLFNIVGFVLVSKIAAGRWTLRSGGTRFCIAVLTVLYLAPWAYGKISMGRAETTGNTRQVSVGIVQPDFDPWEKWSTGASSRWASYDRQMEHLMQATKSLAKDRPDLVVWPETAIPFRILLPQNEYYLRALRANLDSLQMPLLTGLPSTLFYDSANAPITATRDDVRKIYYDDFNSATLFLPGSPTGAVYRKIVLVPFAERIPYAGTFRFLIEPLKWNVGIGMWGIGKDTLVFFLPLRDGSSTTLSSMICYESVYPNFVREFVRRGAEFLVIITNDSWWGNTSGAYQHASYASFRAVENRRWIVRVANGGISGFVDPTGVIHDETKLYTASTLLGTIEPRHDQTFYARHGDVFALFCSGVAGLFILIALIPHRKQDAS